MWNNWQQWGWNWSGMPPNTAPAATAGPPPAPDAAGAASTHCKDGYGYTSFIDPAVAATIDYNHGNVPSDVPENVCKSFSRVFNSLIRQSYNVFLFILVCSILAYWIN